MEGIYVSYDEKKNGNFTEAVEISNNEYLMWKERSRCSRKMQYPATILIKTKCGKYYKGVLLLMGSYEDFNPKIFANPRHRPLQWRKDKGEAKTVFFISKLKAVREPQEVKGKITPQRPVYVKLEGEK